MKVEELLQVAVDKQAADIFLIPGMPLSYRVGGISYITTRKRFSPGIGCFDWRAL